MPTLRAGPISQARYEALRILLRVEQDRAFADIALEHALGAARLEPRDAGLCTEIVYGTLRWQRHLDWRLAPHLRRPLAKLDPWVRALLRLTAYQVLLLDRVPPWAAVDEAVSLARLKAKNPGPAEFVNAVLRALGRAPAPPLPTSPVEAAGVRWSFPDWLAARFLARLGEAEAGALMAALDSRPPTTLRANTLAIDRDALILRIRAEELAEARSTRLAPEGLIVERGAPSGWKAFAEGSCLFQDEASMLIARLLEPRPGETVADTCAAPGTKTTHLAQLMENRGAVIAMDPQAARLRLVDRSAARLGTTIVQTHLGGVAALAPRWRGRCDRVLVDAPCSSLGVLRRNPEVKWRRTEADLARLQRTQRDILAAAATLLRPGGRLVYATCSLEPDENEDVVGPFLAAHSDWRPDPPEAFPVPADAAGFVRLLPHVHDTDGFTAIRLRRPGGGGS
ncbi:MAG: 16S rRNA (cytosine(967)-C(5))-methyltransferase RsmB [Candidatus Rokubacteria bacterium]|nr:16S rRNA (cytosine(967)-C(5))-methyltransferase RsmB [Candidatus Rokubacteria bacterium]